MKRSAPSPRYVASGPENQAVLVGSSVNGVTLKCQVADGVNTSRVQWYEYGTVASGNQISDGNLLLPGHPNYLRYSMDLTNEGQHDLVINPVVLEDGTYYKCQDFNAAPPDQTELGAQLVVIGEYRWSDHFCSLCAAVITVRYH